VVLVSPDDDVLLVLNACRRVLSVFKVIINKTLPQTVWPRSATYPVISYIRIWLRGSEASSTATWPHSSSHWHYRDLFRRLHKLHLQEESSVSLCCILSPLSSSSRIPFLLNGYSFLLSTENIKTCIPLAGMFPCYVGHFPPRTAWRVAMLRMEKTAYRYVG
jgi:hypothetical protein